MVRTQIQLPEDQIRELRALAKELGVSLSEVIRRCIASALAGRTVSRSELYEKASRLVGSMQDPRGATDLSREHDRYLDETFE